MKKKFISKSAFFNPRFLLSSFLCFLGALIALVAFSMYSGPSALAQKPKGNQKVMSKGELVRMIGPVSQDRDLRALPEIPQLEAENEQPLRRHPFTRPGKITTNDPIRAVRKTIEAIAMPTPSATYPGITSAQSACGCLPPDTDGDVGPNHYIQAVNSRFKILDKSGNELLAPTTYNTFFAPLGAGNPCGNNQNDGDAVVFYDHLADRWVISDFAFPAFPGTSFYQCFGVSKTSNPVSGGWWLYALQVDPSNPTYLGDYPKFGMWPDAYYMTVNMFSNNTTFNGVRVYALPRNDMINGTGAPNPGAIAFSIDPATLGDSYSLVPASFRTGSPPPVGTAEYLLAVDSPSAAGVVQTQVHVWRFHVDFAIPANSTFGSGATHAADANITVNGFVDAFTTTSNLVPEPVVTTNRYLDTLGDKIMYPLVYQNLGGTESLWADQTVNNNQGGTGPTGIRWYQFNVTGGVIPATPAQQQTWTNAADGLWRWMPSIALDAQGNMAIGYTASSTTTEPSIRYAGRLAGDPLNSLTEGEAIMQAGGGHQTSTSGRWGDYSSLFVDPTDGLTFWHTNEYYSAIAAAAWNTRIGTFKFTAPAVVSAVSRKNHTGVMDFDVPLPLSGDPGVEDRTGPTAGQHQIIVTFVNPVTVSFASVTSGTGTVASTSVSGSQVTVNLSGVTDAQRLTITLGANDGVNAGNVAIPVAFLLGDTTGDGNVNSSDVSQTKSQSGSAVTGSNFREDVNTNGSVNSGDVSLVKSRSGMALP